MSGLFSMIRGSDRGLLMGNLRISEALREAAQTIRENWVVFVVPFLVVEAVMEALLKAVQFVHGLALLSGLLLLFTVCFASYFLLETTTAAMFFSWRERNVKPSLSKIGDVFRYPRLAATMWRLILLWLGVALGVLLVAAVAFALVVFINTLIHPETQSIHHTRRHLWVRVWLLLYGAILGRYMFVTPLMALKKHGGADVFQAAVLATKPNKWELYGVVTVGNISISFPYWAVTAAADSSLVGHRVELYWKMANVIIVAIIGAYYSLFKTALMTQVIVDGIPAIGGTAGS